MSKQNSVLLEHDEFEGAHSKTSKFSLYGHRYKSIVVKAYDADSVNIVFPFHGVLTRWATRLYGINAPEVRGGTVETKEAGADARDWVREQILGKVVWVHCYGFGKYGRLLCDIYLTDNYDGQTLSDMLLEKGMAVPYMRTEDIIDAK
jgi:endonuclease YncB( thermonuclease family)